MLNFNSIICRLGVLSLLIACQPLDSTHGVAQRQHVKTVPGTSNSAQFPAAQDLAILIPRSPTDKVSASPQGSQNTALLPRRWIDQVSEGFAQTPVGSAIEDENWYEDWQLVAIRIAPCAPLTGTIAALDSNLCWPEIRLVWQPTMYDIAIRGVFQPAYSDDRAIHALYNFVPSGDFNDVTTMLDEIRKQGTVDTEAFGVLRDQAVGQLLNEIRALRMSFSREYGSLSYRSELLADDTTSALFLARLVRWLESNITPYNAHTLTAFSLPSGRQPAGIDLWSFIAFTVTAGQLNQTHLEIIDPLTGEVIGLLQGAETVSSGNADPSLLEQVDDSDAGRRLGAQILNGGSDKDSLGDRINDPHQTLVPNTSCSTCHSFNPLIFNMHNLSYLETDDINVAPRVVADVASDLQWLNRFINQQTPNSDNVEEPRTFH